MRKTVYGKTRQEAHRKLRELQRQATQSGALPGSGNRALNDLLDRCLETAAPTLKPRTLYDYARPPDSISAPA